MPVLSHDPFWIEWKAVFINIITVVRLVKGIMVIRVRPKEVSHTVLLADDFCRVTCIFSSSLQVAALRCLRNSWGQVYHQQIGISNS
ncbi:hypothetical protein PoB_007709300 [Plakobranchus ocellatus]|uniref:Uncharacterized protein n=1 Tax=Plakobranchus ocellatus TaxID=259542 RepID=A0AAV4E2S9_9GAST|nr:hypothetical protein PoB_007709300 [Plakobranchus ocellatus]